MKTLPLLPIVKLLSIIVPTLRRSSLYTTIAVLLLSNRYLYKGITSWAEEEVKTAALGDQRLNKRLVKVLDHLGQHPQISIPAACGGWAETLGAYRFFDNEKRRTGHAAVNLAPPTRTGYHLPGITVNAVLAREETPPPDVESLEWLLVTSLPVASFEQAMTVVAWYAVRWCVEVYFHVLKNGC